MRFRFCGDLDAPDWLLSEIATLSKISSVRMKILVKQVLTHLLEGQIDFEKVLKMTKDTLPEDSDVQGAIAALNYVLMNAAKYDVDEQTLLQEIQQLGMPKENSEAVAKPFKEAKAQLREKLSQDVYRLPKVQSVKWRVDHIMASSSQPDVSEPSVQLQLLVNETPNHTAGGDGNASKALGLRLSADKFQVLYYEMKRARDMLQSLKD